MNNLELATAKERYGKDGYVVFHEVLGKELMEEANSHIDWLMKKYPNVLPEDLGHSYMKDDPFWLRFMSDNVLLDIAEQFVGPDIALFASHYISKPPFVGRPVLWHQDAQWWPLEPREVITLWIAIDDAVVENGCLRVIPGSHMIELQEMQANTKVDSVLNVEIDPALVDESKTVNLVQKSGSVSVLHPNIIHGSEANRSPMRRCGISTQYISTRSKILVDDNKPWPSAFLLRGMEVPGLNQYQPRPKYVEGQSMPFRGSEAWV